jgi:hypothetical protein
VLSQLLRRLFTEGLLALHRAGQLAFFGDLDQLVHADAFANWRAPFRESEWVVYAKPPFAGPEAVLAYLCRYTHRVAISNHRLVSADADTAAFHWKDYRIKSGDRKKGHAAGHAGVHPSLPDPRPSGWLPSHSPLRPARLGAAQGQRRQSP